MDSYVRTYIRVHVKVDSGNRAFCDGKPMDVILSGGIKKVQLPISKILYSFDDLKRAGAEVHVPTVRSLALAGAEGRWKDEIKERVERGIPSNVYVANARSINKALKEGRTPPDVRWIGRQGSNMTEVYDTIDEVVKAMDENRWRKVFSRGSRARKSK